MLSYVYERRVYDLIIRHPASLLQIEPSCLAVAGTFCVRFHWGFNLCLMCVGKRSLFTRKEGNVLFNDTLNTFYLRLYGVGHMVEEYSNSERGNPMPPHGLLFPLNNKVLLYAPSHRQNNTYHGLCYTSCGELAGTRNSSTIHRIMSKPSYHGATSRSSLFTNTNDTESSDYVVTVICNV